MVETFTEYRARMALERLLFESPMLVNSDTPNIVNTGSKSTTEYINTNHKQATKIGDDLYHLKHAAGYHIYYHTVDNKPNELSLIGGNIQSGVTKGVNGDVTHIHNIMKHHVENHGVLSSSKSNTNGSKKLWVNFIKKNPQFEFSVHNSIEKTSYPVDHKLLILM